MPRILTLPFLTLALLCPAVALADDHDCEARADAVVADMAERSSTPAHGRREASRAKRRPGGLRRPPVLPPKAEVEPTEPEPQTTAFQRFVSGLFSMDTKPARKRSGKYRYLEKD